ncbi:MAG: heme-binding domain-containing protein [Candidatus Binataceae bacterium]
MLTVLTRPWLIGLLTVGAVLITIQLVPVERTNPAVEGDIGAPPPVESILKRACYDCHSNLTRWRWYSHVAPFSWLMVHDVKLARMEVNFSRWSSYYPQTRRRKLEWIGRELANQAMPPWQYRLVHPEARLSSHARVMLRQWIQSSLTAADAPNIN